MKHDKIDLLDALRIDRAAPTPPTPPRQAVRWTAIALGAAILAVAAGTGWSVLLGKQLPGASLLEQTTSVRVATAQPLAQQSGVAAGTALLNATGYVVARRAATVGPKVAGRLRDVLVDEGMHVEAGQVIAHLDDSNAIADLNQAKATLDQATIAATDGRPAFERSRALLAKGLTSQEAFETAKATYNHATTAVAVAQSAVAVAQQNLDDTVISALFSGVVTVKAAQAGEIISPMSAGSGFTRTGVATIVDMDSLEVEVDVNESFINRVRPDQGCKVTLNAYPDWQIPGHVIAVVPTADRTKATVRVRVGFNIKDPRILPEIGAKVAFLADAKSQPEEAPPSGVAVPSEAILSSGGENVLFVVRDDHAERRTVKLGAQAAGNQIVQSGLTAGETVAVTNLDKLSNGLKVKTEQ
ncbi:efflux RND transporter periplasmic adaptor subunit [Mesorhizobium sp. B2-4-12]|uniref:efflux RND transporter periplasmic adaptor subunit n=1 Tax=unclassified Mesorhizobium TaxID=325217 RepID=UPI0011264E01|nr:MULTISPECIES: efflux RND transporter periplasmic adaptor subunit [unclassified Mesorhizobium]TPK93914.1 efflux RND transporter periplasmic adaptor subunit [Mesorhizobium sp. B2-4-12]TPL09611.1 efflux RND transporter periplasmic adaptor subunit [Mesorhizobium sp. B2-4-14]